MRNAVQKISATITVEEAVRISSGLLTVGEEQFAEAEALWRAGKSTEAVQAFEKLRAEFPHIWIDRAAQERFTKIRAAVGIGNAFPRAIN